MKSFQPAYLGSVPRPAAPVVVISSRVPRPRHVPHRRPAEPGVGADAGGVEVPLVPAVGDENGCTPAVAGSLSTSTGRSRLRRSKIEKRPVAVAGRVGVAAVGLVDAGDGVGAGGARRAGPDDRAGRVGDVDDPQLAAADVDVLGLGRGWPRQRRPRPARTAGCRAPVRRSPQFMASFSNRAWGRMPTSVGSVASETSHTRIESTPLVTKSGAVCRKQPEIATWPGLDARCWTLPLISGGVGAVAPRAPAGAARGAHGRACAEAGAASGQRCRRGSPRRRRGRAGCACTAQRAARAPVTRVAGQAGCISCMVEDSRSRWRRPARRPVRRSPA